MENSAINKMERGLRISQEGYIFLAGRHLICMADESAKQLEYIVIWKRSWELGTISMKVLLLRTWHTIIPFATVSSFYFKFPTSQKPVSVWWFSGDIIARGADATVACERLKRYVSITLNSIFHPVQHIEPCGHYWRDGFDICSQNIHNICI